jgi:hypothetical protein
MRSTIPVLTQPVVDRLAFVLPHFRSPLLNDTTFIAPISRRIAREIADGSCLRAYQKGCRYLETFRILLDGGSPAFVQIGALQPDRQHGGIRVDVNPARFGPDDAEQFNAVMRRIVGRIYPELMKDPLLNSIDLAVDISGVHLDQILVSYNHSQRYTMFCKRQNAHGHIEGYNFGSVSSDYMTVAYDKHQERIHAAILAVARSGVRPESLKSNAVIQLKQVLNADDKVRVEVRGKKLRGLPLYKLDTLPNRFERFQFTDLNIKGSTLSPLVQAALLAMCRQDGTKATLAAFKHSKQARKVNAFLRSRKAAWWQPELLWQQGCDAVREIGLFPEAAFAPPRERAYEQD